MLDSESGVVTRIQGDKALVNLVRSNACDDCEIREICQPGEDGFRGIIALNTLHAQVGDIVKIAETGNRILKLSMLQFGVPLLGLVLGILAMYYIQPSDAYLPKEVIMSIGGLIGLLVSGIIVWSILNIWSRSVSYMVEIVRVNKATNANKKPII